jgi:hypothetical protein
MDKYTHHANAFDRPVRGEAAHAAEVVRNDFTALFLIFDRQFNAVPTANGQVHSHAAEARSAAKRGMELSNQLLRTLRQGH